MNPERKEVTALLSGWTAGDRKSRDDLMELVYHELRRLAAHYLQNERGDHTLQPTALVHELYLKLFAAESIGWQDRGHFLAVAARQLRRIIVDYARAQHAQKRGGSQGKISLEEAHQVAVRVDDTRLVELDDALQRLEQLDSRAAHVVELRFFGGLTEKEVGQTLEISEPTVKRDWEFARAWLLKELG